MILTSKDEVPAYWWHDAPNFGDLITPWLIEKMTGKQAVLSSGNEPHYVAIGSILAYVKPSSIVWGTGCFGIEQKSQIQANAKYLAVRGPLTRNKLTTQGVKCPSIYGDPALLVPEYYWPENISITYELGIVLRHSEGKWLPKVNKDGVKVIYLRNDNVEETILEILSCRRIVTTSLHGLILADAYRIPNAWITSESPYGKDFKYWDYFLSVHKVRDPQPSNCITEGWSLGRYISEIKFDSRDIKIDLNPLRSSCPFLSL